MKIKFEISEPFEKERFSLDDLKIDVENIRPEDLQDEFSRTVVIDKLLEIESDDINIMRKILHLTEEIESISLVTKLKIQFTMKL